MEAHRSRSWPRSRAWLWAEALKLALACHWRNRGPGRKGRAAGGEARPDPRCGAARSASRASPGPKPRSSRSPAGAQIPAAARDLRWDCWTGSPIRRSPARSPLARQGRRRTAPAADHERAERAHPPGESGPVRRVSPQARAEGPRATRTLEDRRQHRSRLHAAERGGVRARTRVFHRVPRQPAAPRAGARLFSPSARRARFRASRHR